MNKQFLRRLKAEIQADEACDDEFSLSGGDFYWTPETTKQAVGYQKEFADGWTIIKKSRVINLETGEALNLRMGDPDDIQSVISQFCRFYGVDPAVFSGIQEPEDLVRTMNHLKDHDKDPIFNVLYYRNVRVTDPSAIFFTKEACEEFIRERYPSKEKDGEWHPKRIYAGNSMDLAALITNVVTTDWGEDEDV